MSENPKSQAMDIVKQAYQALRVNDRAQARKLASYAVRLSPDLEEAWLILSALSSPQTSLEYAEKALQINPGSERALRALAWSKKRLEEAQPLPSAGIAEASQPVQEKPVTSDAAPAVETRREDILPDIGVLRPASKAAKGSKHLFPWIWLVGLTLVIGFSLAAWLGWPFISSLFEHNTSARPLGVLFKPSLTPSQTPTATDTQTPTVTATKTATHTPTASVTFTPTNTLTNTATRTRTATAKPTLTRSSTTKTSVPVSPPLGVKIPTGIQAGEHWIDVDISKQRAYAYEGSTLVRSFVVSTGIASYPSVTGTYRIYVKYRYAPMSGVGWYLPNVPYVMYYYKGYGLHGTYWHNNFGTPMSHGCINFKIDEAGWVYNFTVVGTVVNLHY